MTSLGSNFCEMLNKPSKIAKVYFSKSGEISPNLVTLVPVDVNSVHTDAFYTVG